MSVHSQVPLLLSSYSGVHRILLSYSQVCISKLGAVGQPGLLDYGSEFQAWLLAAGKNLFRASCDHAKFVRLHIAIQFWESMIEVCVSKLVRVKGE